MKIDINKVILFLCACVCVCAGWEAQRWSSICDEDHPEQLL